MDLNEAVTLIRDAVGPAGGRAVWADLGAGAGTFTRALARILESGSTIYAVDQDDKSIAALRKIEMPSAIRVVPVKSDFTRALELPGLGSASLDGILLANSLHFVRAADAVLTRLVQHVRVGGRVLVVEYDRRAPSRWVPYPIPASAWPRFAEAAGLTAAAVTATLPSVYAGVLYAGVAVRA